MSYTFPSRALSPTVFFEHMFGNRVQDQTDTSEFGSGKERLNMAEELTANSLGVDILLSIYPTAVADTFNEGQDIQFDTARIIYQEQYDSNANNTPFSSENIFTTNSQVCRSLEKLDPAFFCISDLSTRDFLTANLKFLFRSWQQEGLSLDSFSLHEQQKREDDIRNKVGKKGYYYFQDRKIFWLDENAPAPQGAIPLDTSSN